MDIKKKILGLVLIGLLFGNSGNNGVGFNYFTNGYPENFGGHLYFTSDKLQNFGGYFAMAGNLTENNRFNSEQKYNNLSYGIAHRTLPFLTTHFNLLQTHYFGEGFLGGDIGAGVVYNNFETVHSWEVGFIFSPRKFPLGLHISYQKEPSGIVIGLGYDMEY